MVYSKLNPLQRPHIFNKLFIIRLLFIISAFVITTVLLIQLYYKSEKQVRELANKKRIENLNNIKLDAVWFPNVGNNVTGWERDIVPSIVHYILLGGSKITFVHMLSILSTVKIQRPEIIIIHCDCDKIDNSNEHWSRIIQEVNKTNDVIISVNNIGEPTKIFDTDLNWSAYHAAEVARWKIMSEYGGIYLDNDVFICQPLDAFSRFEFTLNWDENHLPDSHVLIGSEKARFPLSVLQTYKAYYGSPIETILNKHPFLVHRVKGLFGSDAANVCPYFYSEYHADWQNKFYTLRMIDSENSVARKKLCLKSRKHFMWYTIFTDDVVKNLQNTFGEMARFVLYGKKDITNLDIQYVNGTFL